ncbi:hypothetical protein Tco_0760306 [Tanacetum coccineum]
MCVCPEELRGGTMALLSNGSSHSRYIRRIRQSPRYIPESDPEEDPKEDDEEDPEEDPANYHADRGDSRDDEESSDDDDDDDDAEEEEHLTPADPAVAPSPLSPYSSPLPQIPSPSLPIPSPSPNSPTYVEGSLGSRAAGIRQRDALPSHVHETEMLEMCLPLPGTARQVGPTTARADLYGFGDTLEAAPRRPMSRELGYGIRDAWDDLVIVETGGRHSGCGDDEGTAGNLTILMRHDTAVVTSYDLLCSDSVLYEVEDFMTLNIGDAVSVQIYFGGRAGRDRRTVLSDILHCRNTVLGINWDCLMSWEGWGYLIQGSVEFLWTFEILEWCIWLSSYRWGESLSTAIMYTHRCVRLERTHRHSVHRAHTTCHEMFQTLGDRKNGRSGLTDILKRILLVSSTLHDWRTRTRGEEYDRARLVLAKRSNILSSIGVSGRVVIEEEEVPVYGGNG